MEYSVWELEKRAYIDYFDEKEKELAEFCKVKHDFQQQILYMLVLLERKEYTQLEDFLKEILPAEGRLGNNIVNTGNIIVDALVNYKYNFAKAYGINFNAKINIPTEIPIEDRDLALILGNALDNAIEANNRGNVKNKYIQLKMRYDRGNLFIIIENSFDGCLVKNKKNEVMTRKEDKGKHGFGIATIKEILLKYKGYMNVNIHKMNYKLGIVLYCQE